jgi:hypothetical protein
MFSARRLQLQVRSSPPPSILCNSYFAYYLKAYCLPTCQTRRSISIRVMTHEEAESSKPTRGREALLGSSARMRPLAGEKDPPPYGAQHRQDALWEGE